MTMKSRFDMARVKQAPEKKLLAMLAEGPATATELSIEIHSKSGKVAAMLDAMVARGTLKSRPYADTRLYGLPEHF